jgi:hypothetical protein
MGWKSHRKKKCGLTGGEKSSIFEQTNDSSAFLNVMCLSKYVLNCERWKTFSNRRGLISKTYEVKLPRIREIWVQSSARWQDFPTEKNCFFCCITPCSLADHCLVSDERATSIFRIPFYHEYGGVIIYQITRHHILEHSSNFTYLMSTAWFHVFPSFPASKYGDITSNQATTASIHIISNSLRAHNFIIWRYRDWVTDSLVA